MSHECNERPRIRVAAVIVKDGSILLVRHVKEGKTYWLLPGGGVEYGEPLAEGLAREVREETGLEIRPGVVLLLNDSIPPDRHRHIVNVCFTADLVGGRLALGDDERLAEVRFIPVEELASIELYPDIRDVLLNAVQHGLPLGATYLGNLWKEIR